MNILVTGGAGYIGSIITERLLEKGHNVVVMDNLQQGHRQAVAPRADFHRADIRDSRALDDIFESADLDAVMHMAAETVVEYSATDPKRFFESSLTGGLALLDAMLKHHVDKLIFSSSAAVYGEPEIVPITEVHPASPINSYGESKLLFERVLHWYEKAYGLKYVSLRYFNAAGASRKYGECHRPETHLIPNVLKAALQKGATVTVFGADYPTRDGSCVRDYVHVLDIAEAHILALEKIAEKSGNAYNLGNGEGYSVLEVVAAAGKVTGVDIPVKKAPRRPGDPAALVASSRRALEELGWRPSYTDLESIVAGAWEWLKQHPDGY